MAAANKTEQALMRQALALARRGQGRVEPNPMVGCVLERDGQVIGRGYHRRFGGPHAEIEALADAQRRGETPAGAHVYVTLEPCPHFGKTPPCVDALIDAKVAAVTAAMQDPFAQVAGRGLARLRAAGIEVRAGLCEDEARVLNQPYLKRLATGLPWVIAKWAQTLDGAIATTEGDSKWISNAQSRRWVHQLRARVDAIIVGIGTAMRDDPLLTARDVPLRRVARRVVVDPRLRLGDDCRLLQTLDPAHPVIIATQEQHLAAQAPRVQALADRGIECVGLPPLPSTPDRLDLRPLLRHLCEARAATNVLIEGGSHLLGTCFQQHLVDQALVFLAPKLLGDANALTAVTGLSTPRIADALPLRLHHLQRLGDDLLLDYRPIR